MLVFIAGLFIGGTAVAIGMSCIVMFSKNEDWERPMEERK